MCSMISQKVVDGWMIKLSERVGWMTRKKKLDFGSDLQIRSADQWDTKHEWFSLAEVVPRPSAILLYFVYLSDCEQDISSGQIQTKLCGQVGC